MGVERRSMIISDEEKRITAFHEAGHTLVARLLPNTDPVHKVTIIPRGMALGLTQQLPVDERHTYAREYLVDRIAVMYGGRAAEELEFDRMTTGAGNDIEQATEMARKMVCEWGMSEKLGPLAFGRNEEQPFLGRDFGGQKDYSEATAREIDAEIRELCIQGAETARSLLASHRETLDRMAEALLEREVLDGKEIDLLMAGEPLPPLRTKEPRVAAQPPGRVGGARPRGAGAWPPRSATPSSFPRVDPRARGASLGSLWKRRDETRSRVGALQHGGRGRRGGGSAPRRLSGCGMARSPSASGPGSWGSSTSRRTPSTTVAGGPIPGPRWTAPLELVEEGAAVVDVGGESTRPGAPEVPVDEELRRVLPVVEALARTGDRPDLGRHLEGGGGGAGAGRRRLGDQRRDRPRGPRHGAGGRGGRRGSGPDAHGGATPRTMQAETDYDDVVVEVCSVLDHRARIALDHGIDPRSIVLDPGIGFAKTADQSWELVGRLDELAGLGFPVLVGPSPQVVPGRGARRGGARGSPGGDVCRLGGGRAPRGGPRPDPRAAGGGSPPGRWRIGSAGAVGGGEA